MRQRGDSTPVLVLTARDGVTDRVTGLREGADDYMVKPFAMQELVARLQALLGRSDNLLGRQLTFGNVALDTEGRQVIVAGTVESVSRARDGGARDPAPDAAATWRPSGCSKIILFGFVGRDVGSNAVEVYIHRLRKMLVDAGATAGSIQCVASVTRWPRIKSG